MNTLRLQRTHRYDKGLLSPYAITGADGLELSDRWQEALKIRQWIETIWNQGLEK